MSRRLRRLILIPILVTAVLLSTNETAKADNPSPDVSAKGAILIEAGSGRVLYEKNADVRFEPASTTKIMTAILAIESGDLDRIVTVSENSAGTEGSTINLKSGETLPLRELIYGLMLQSGNDSAVAIAESVGGSTEKFVEMMNRKAEELGLTDTHCENPNGLHVDGHETTPRELALIAAYAMRNDFFRTVVSTQYRTAENTSAAHSFRNKNKLLSTYEGYNGIKTGYTKAAGKCLVFAAKQNGMQLIGVVMQAPKMWNDAKNLLDFGFAAFEMHKICSSEDCFFIDVLKGEKKSLLAGPNQDILYPIRKDGTESISVSKSVSQSVIAPTVKEQKLGEWTVLINGTVLMHIPIVAMEDVEQIKYSDVWKNLLRSW